MVKASGRKKRRFLPEKAEGKQLEATNSESGKMHHRTPCCLSLDFLLSTKEFKVSDLTNSNET